jgi:hypothetical protein
MRGITTLHRHRSLYHSTQARQIQLGARQIQLGARQIQLGARQMLLGARQIQLGARQMLLIHRQLLKNLFLKVQHAPLPALLRDISAKRYRSVYIYSVISGKTQIRYTTGCCRLLTQPPFLHQAEPPSRPLTCSKLPYGRTATNSRSQHSQWPPLHR